MVQIFILGYIEKERSLISLEVTASGCSCVHNLVIVAFASLNTTVSLFVQVTYPLRAITETNLSNIVGIKWTVSSPKEF
ncbi:hypothetical protein MtrunA17_Chr6g0483951 [Medicago truncatula]|uniref:Uncharacterized protein n=1 Tax=Medicago truncatula TaxID=3880 RepID=A0A396HJH0_MEDTR|nr:hypothetical protein MtrunA17_Chr6g0483951 [Medicago truncatula]